MKNAIPLLLSLLVCSILAFSPKPPSPFEIADQYMYKLTQIEQFNGIILLEDEHGNVFHEAYNMNVPIDGMQVEKESALVIASVSKLFFKQVLLDFEQSGTISLDEPVQKYLPAFPYEEITLKQLKNHTSGLPRELLGKGGSNNVPEPATLSEYIKLICEESLLSEPGEKYHYSNLGFILLYRIIENIAEKPYPEVMDSLIFRPAGMNQTVDLHTETPPPAWVAGYKKDDENQSVILGDMRFSQRFRSGDWTSSASDLHKFLAFVEGEEGLYENDTLRHGGARSGYRSYVFHSKKSGHKVIFLSNYANVPFLKLADDLAKIMDGKPIKMPKELYRVEISLPGELLESYTGTYRLEAEMGTEFQFKVREDALYFEDEKLGWIPMMAEDSTSFFFYPKDPETIRFVWDSTAQHYDMELIIEGGMSFFCPRVVRD